MSVLVSGLGVVASDGLVFSVLVFDSVGRILVEVVLDECLRYTFY